MTSPYQHERALFIQNYVDGMTDALIVNGNGAIKLGRIAVGSVNMIDSFHLAQDKTHHLNFLGLQVQESLMTSFLRRDYRVVEFRRTNQLLLKENYDQMLSRQLTELSNSQEFNYFLTGTMKYQDNGAIINLRMVDLSNNEVVSATTKLVPSDVFWPRNQVMMNNGLIYRSSN
ncbi:FlgO family outer membrane protein [Thalassotalea sp. SU-HH00458]|uniref:FlgO family outer membrane protein n=1 Tax=Thalassotalea sp. SU-HH00458 TaxID=3127657 RepID=UPI003105B2C1